MNITACKLPLSVSLFMYVWTICIYYLVREIEIRISEKENEGIQYSDREPEIESDSCYVFYLQWCNVKPPSFP